MYNQLDRSAPPASMVSPYNLREKWPSYSHDNVCGLCGRPKPCRYSPDGSVVMCVRVSAGAFKEKNGWYFHRIRASNAADVLAAVERAGECGVAGGVR